jgi:hypothetical protein
MSDGKQFPARKRHNDGKSGVGTYETSKDALAEISDAFNYWSEQITATSLQMCYALIGANWVIFGSVGNILHNRYAMLSLLLVMAAVAFNLLSSYVLAEYLRTRFDYGASHQDLWEKEFQKEKSKATTWPYAKWMEGATIAIRLIKVILPLASGVSLIAGALA